MEIDTTRVITDEHRNALDRLMAGELTKEEYKKVLQHLPDWAKSLSDIEYERLFQLTLEGDAVHDLNAGFAVVFAKTMISGRIEGRLAGLDNLPDQMARLERVAQFEMASEVACIKDSLKDEFTLPTLEIVRLYKRALNDKYELLEKELDLQIKKRRRKDTLGTSDLNFEYELNRREKMLAKICPLFERATPHTQRDVWIKLAEFTRKQWALFLIEINPSRKKYTSEADAVNAIIKPLAKTIEEISGLSNFRSISINEGSPRYSKDLKKVQEIISFLRADTVMRKSRLVTPNKNLTEP